MSQPRIPAALRAAVRERAGGGCEYCRMPEAGAFFAHEPDHVIATQHRGQTELANLALACLQCKRFKGPNIASVDPETKRIVPLLGVGRVWRASNHLACVLQSHELIARNFSTRNDTLESANPRDHTAPLPWDEAVKVGHYLLDEQGRLKESVREIFHIIADKNVAGFNSYFPMPYAKGARVVIENTSNQPIRALYFHVDYQKWPKPPSPLRFHALYRESPPEPYPGDAAGARSAKNPTGRDNRNQPHRRIRQ